MDGHLLLVDGFPGSGKSRLGGIIQKQLGSARVRVFDADDFTQALLSTIEPSSCAGFRKRIVRRANRELMKQITAVPPQQLVVVVGLVHIILDEKCNADITQCQKCCGCDQSRRHVHRVWLNITPPRSRAPLAELEESVKRAVLRELVAPASTWAAPDPDSADPWDHMSPPLKPMSRSTKARWFKKSAAQFRRKYSTYFDAMLESFRLDGFDRQTSHRVMHSGYQPMRERNILALARRLASAGSAKTR